MRDRSSDRKDPAPRGPWSRKGGFVTQKKVRLTEDQWREKLSPEQFEIARRGGTERAFTGKYYDSKETGMYHCVCCDAPLFSSETKYDSGSGWPSFTSPERPENLRFDFDDSYGMRRVEVRCAVCDAHLGHVFDDGPTEEGKRFCINSASLDLRSEDDK